MALTQYQKRMMVRKTSDLDRLAKQYKGQVQSVAGSYETEFASYQKNVAEQMKPYEEAVAKYKVDSTAYQSAVDAYQNRLNQYQAAIKDVQARPYDYLGFDGTMMTGAGGDWKIASAVYVPSQKKWLTPAQLEKAGYEVSANKYGTLAEAKKARVAPTFTEKAPAAPEQPKAPQIQPFDESSFTQKKEQLQQDFNREVGERKSARLSAVSRRSSRPMLQGA